MSAVCVGIDLAWSTGTTGVAAVDPTGRLLTSTSVSDDEEIADWLSALPRAPRVVAVDAPLVVPNDAGQRPAERLIGHTFGSYGAAAHSANRTLLRGEPRAMRLARRFDWSVDPTVRPGHTGTACIEVYPHPAQIGLFELPYRLGYKKGSAAARLPTFGALLDHLETIPELQLSTHGRWRLIREDVAAHRPGVPGRYEDEVDAILCAHLAWLWDRHPDALHVYGSVEEGYIVAPPPPTHRPTRPTPATAEALVRSARAWAPSAHPRRLSAQHLTMTPVATGRLQGDAEDVRALLIDRIAQGAAPVTYGDVASHVGRIANGLGPLLDEVERICTQRGEPNLAVLVVNKSTREPTKYAHHNDDWLREQERCLLHHWRAARTAPGQPE
jgi:predicted RNase H-like nuclease